MGMFLWGLGARRTLLHSMTLRVDVCGFVPKVCQPSEHDGAMVFAPRKCLLLAFLPIFLGLLWYNLQQDY